MSNKTIGNWFNDIPSLEMTRTADWCETHVVLSHRVPTASPGAWRKANVPALWRPGGPLEALDDPLCETVIVMKGSQTALTTSCYAWLMKELVNDPGSALIVMNSTQDARDKSAETWRPCWEDSPALKNYVPANRRRDWTKLYQLINGSPVYWIGANSPGRLASKPIRRLMLDEVDKYPSGFGRRARGKAASNSEAGAAALARQRTKAFKKNGLAKIVEVSTPTDEQGEIMQEYLNGDQCKLNVKCPLCGAVQIMVWASFRVDMNLAKEDPAKAVDAAHYECPSCHGAWSDNQRWAAIDNGEWKPTAKPRDPKCRSFWLPSWCSRFVTTGYLARQWLRAQQSKSALQDFINSECGEPFVHYENAIADAVFTQLEGGYAEGERFAASPQFAVEYKDIPKIVLCGCDVQKGYLMAVFREFVEGGDSGLIWAGDVADLQTLDRLAAKYGSDWIFLDSRYRTQEVNEWAASHTGYIPVQGVTRRGKTLFTLQAMNIDEGKRGQAQGRVVQTLAFDPDMAKDILSCQIQRDAAARRWLIPKGYSTRADYIAEMTAEKSIAGHWAAWPPGRDNHFWDAETMVLVGAVALGWFKLIDVEEPEKKKEEGKDNG